MSPTITEAPSEPRATAFSFQFSQTSVMALLTASVIPGALASEQDLSPTNVLTTPPSFKKQTYTSSTSQTPTSVAPSVMTLKKRAFCICSPSSPLISSDIAMIKFLQALSVL